MKTPQNKQKPKTTGSQTNSTGSQNKLTRQEAGGRRLVPNTSVPQDKMRPNTSVPQDNT
jgi:hypothetical protein